MTTLMLAVVVAVGSAACYAVGAVHQERLAVQVPVRRLGALLRRRQWWLAVGLVGAGALLHIVALRYGPLSLIQPLGALTLVLALPVGAAMAGRRVSVPQWRGASLTMAGLAVLLLLTAPTGHVRGLSAAQVLAVIVVAGGAVGVLSLAALVAWRAAPRSLLFATAAGIAFGVGSALTQTVAIGVTGTGVAGLLHLATPAVVGFALGGFLLSQAGYRGSGLGAPLATLTLVNPVAAAVIGLTLLGERFAGGGAGAGLAVAAAAAATWGVVLLVRPAPDPGLGAGADRLPGPLQRPAQLLAFDINVGQHAVEPARQPPGMATE